MPTQDSPVIIAGFGRFGQIVGRLLIGNHCSVTVLDHSAAHIARVREFGFKVFYGDASRVDLLETAGAKEAKLLIIAIDDREKTNEMVVSAKRHFPNAKILTRAFDVMHFHELYALGADYVEREMFLGSLNLGKQALLELGMNAAEAARKTDIFAKTDTAMMLRLGEHRDDRKRYISESLLARDEMMKILQAEKKESSANLNE